ncbi:hypothetical protein C8R42DRAFT_654284 [Lentinula raphanica]|nr:hypothetical protein C8R42DRAFT_654284 [Lentinula raphanica]
MYIEYVQCLGKLGFKALQQDSTEILQQIFTWTLQPLPIIASHESPLLLGRICSRMSWFHKRCKHNESLQVQRTSKIYIGSTSLGWKYVRRIGMLLYETRR